MCARCPYQLRFRCYLRRRNMYADPSHGWAGRQWVSLTVTFPCQGRRKKKKEERSRPQRGRGPLGTIGNPTIRGINMLDTSPPRGNAFVTPGNISVCPSLHIQVYIYVSLSLSLFVSYGGFPTACPLIAYPRRPMSLDTEDRVAVSHLCTRGEQSSRRARGVWESRVPR